MNVKYFVVLALALVCIVVFFKNPLQQKDLVEFSIMSYADYEPIEHATPYTYRLFKGNQCLFYFGANHSHDLNNEQYPQLESFWQKFLEQTQGKNCVVLVEGSLRKLAQTKQEAITTGGEARYVTLLAHQADIFVQCPEPSDALIMHELQRNFSQEK